MKEAQILKSYEIARERYAALGVDTDKAIEQLEKQQISLHCWQTDDVMGFERDEALSGIPRLTEEERQALILRAKEVIPEKAAFYAEKIGVTYGRITIRSQKTRWGSCSANGVIRISIWLLMAPPSAIDYVLVHELAHRKHFDHSSEFWRLVESITPDYRVQKKCLRSFQEEPFLLALAKKET